MATGRLRLFANRTKLALVLLFIALWAVAPGTRAFADPDSVDDSSSALAAEEGAAEEGALVPATDDAAAVQDDVSPATDATDKTTSESDEPLLEPASDSDALLAEARSYTYEVRPLLAPFNEYLYLITDNPDPESLILRDTSSTYLSGNYEANFRVETTTFLDVVYEDVSSHRVSGGYLFRDEHCDSDGGTLSLCVAGEDGEVVDTGITLTCPALMTYIDYLIDTYATGATLFDKLDAVQDALNNLAVYPHGVYDTDSPNEETPYPFYVLSPYYENDLNAHYEMYDFLPAGGLLETALYPFVLDSAGFPGTISMVAERLEPGCEVTQGDVHYMINVTFDGETRSYGGAGIGGNSSLLGSPITKTFLFDGSDQDWARSASIEKLRDSYLAYSEQGAEDIQTYAEQLAGAPFKEAVGSGSWLGVMTEGGFAYSKSYTYVTKLPDGYVEAVSNCWVDGRYISIYEQWLRGATFEEYPTASIVLRGISYTASDGTQQQGDLIYDYNSSSETWVLQEDYETHWTLPDDTPHELTKEQVEELVPDARTNEPLAGWLIYDGTQPPGTPHERVTVTGVVIPDKASLCTGGHLEIPMTIEPADADELEVTWTSSDESVATAKSSWYVDGSDGKLKRSTSISAQSIGTATLTCTSFDGKKSASCTVTVTPVSTDIEVPEYVYLTVGQSKQLTARVLPANAAQATSWMILHGDIATIDEQGVVTGVNVGTTWAYCTATDGREAYVSIQVLPRLDSIALPETASVSVGGSVQLSAVTTPEVDYGLTWTSSDESVATVDDDGWVTTHKRGTATITVASPDGERSATCVVTVMRPAENVTITPDRLYVGQETQLEAVVSPADACRTITDWWSYDTEVAEVDSNTGVARGISPGWVSIGCFTTDGLGFVTELLVIDNDLAHASVSGSVSYTGKALAPTVTLGGERLKAGRDFSISYQNAAGKSIAPSDVKLPGTYRATIVGAGDFVGRKVATFKVVPAAQKLVVKAVGKTVKAKTAKKKAVTLKPLVASGAMTKLSYKKVSGAKQLTVNAKTGKVKVKKGTKKGTYKIKVRVTAAANSYYKAVSKTVTVKVVVR